MFKIALAAVIFGSSFAAGYAMRPVVSPPGATVPSPAATCWSPDMSRLPGIAEQGCGAPDVPAGGANGSTCEAPTCQRTTPRLSAASAGRRRKVSHSPARQMLGVRNGFGSLRPEA
jgi:hypothetical protein